MSARRYTLSQLLGAYAAGKRGAGSPGYEPAPAERREVDFAAGELVALAGKHGLVAAFGRSSESHHWARGIIVHLAGRYGEGAVDAAFDEAERRLLAAGHDANLVGFAMDCLDRRREDVLADMVAINASLDEEPKPCP